MYYIGIDLGGTNIAGGLVGEDGKLYKKLSVPTNSQRAAEEIIKDIADLSKKLIEDLHIDKSSVRHIGIGVPGLINDEKGDVVYCSNLNFNNIPIKKIMEQYTDVPVFLGNDANCAALAESVAGSSKGTEHSIAITLGTGVGGGIVINKRIYKGFNDAAGELGHIVIVSGGEKCGCGANGCWEAYASATALIKQTREAAKNNPESYINKLIGNDPSKINAKTAFDAAKNGDKTGRMVVEQYIKYIAEGLVSIINIFQPEMIVIGGGVSKEGEYILEPLRQIIYKNAFCRDDIPRTKIVRASMGNDAGIIGAAMLGV